MGLGPMNAVYQAQLNRYLHHRGIADTSDQRVWAFLGDGEMDEPESRGFLQLAANDGLDNLVFVINCNLQRLDGPVRGNGKIVQELEGFFRGMPSLPGLGIVIVTHLSPWRESVLHEIVSRFTDLPVEVAADGHAVAENHVYVLPADAVVGIRNGILVVQRQGADQRERHPVDIFLSALAADQGEHSGGVILSGGDSDGTLGIKAIKEHGGITLAQVANGDGPQHPEMPSSAIATGYVDFGVPSHEMGDKLVAYRRSLSMTDAILAGGGPDEAGRSPDELRGEIYAILRAQVGHDFGG
jgi:two-component system CheB/CheR fusion protein